MPFCERGGVGDLLGHMMAFDGQWRFALLTTVCCSVLQLCSRARCQTAPVSSLYICMNVD